ncbi:glycosyltransferase WbuB [Herbaspirillum seropedicae]|uniref:glycosyltransferase family 4 protein n=1 Tax=Herbaspirillum seropedicae TaxID=964 RepID=UPI0011236E6D|nr:glycosyltransferase family 4 protein [Herbaspirillum seropedicae]QDD66452.1 glycosyltransferase WbuB [Herbaspirillum seropedicae]
MRVLIVSQYFWPEGFRINDVAKTLIEKGIEVDVLTGKPNYPSGRLVEGYRIWGVQRQSWNGVNIYRIPLLVRGNSGFRLTLNYFSFVISGLLTAPWLFRKKKYDAIFVYGTSPILQAIPALFLGWLKKRPTVLWVQDLWPESLTATGYVRNNAIIAAVRSVVSWIYRKSSVLLVQSRAFDEPVRALAGTTPIVYYPNSVDDTFAVPTSEAAPAVEGIGRGFTVMFAGNIGKAQGVDVILAAAAMLRDHADIHFVVLGDGSSRSDMLQAAKEQGLVNLHLPGRFPVETMPAFMQNASALLVTLTDQPIFAVTVPNKVQAYMAAGRPIIACLNGEGARIVTEAKAGLAVPAENATALAQAILQLYEMPESEREKMGGNGRRFYQEHFNHDVLVDQLIEHLAKAAHKGKEIQ